MKILAVCGNGLGSSMVLRMTAEAVLKDLGVKASIKTADISSAKSEEADIIITSEQFSNMLTGSIDAPIVTVKNYVDRGEMKEKLEPALANL
ncbi:PTS sugar transporter subunit IIB [Virgibacillus necropolis]|uniref:PTS ascorbate transporter subunit IIB n=1 Tax=Virgibacillus necropolis TaxID=163877 RepID=A0A221M9R1_9BACI|nr:PTS sugar transporter subunit IIB [Virgibacillus necropolis]ASN04383.1 PTS ascorbate transporter subunit IIB [Virgibacillus necropolis]